VYIYTHCSLWSPVILSGRWHKKKVVESVLLNLEKSLDDGKH